MFICLRVRDHGVIPVKTHAYLPFYLECIIISK